MIPRYGSGMGRGTLAAAAVGVLAILGLALELAHGADPGDALLYLGYALAYVVVPGWLLVAALRPELRGSLTGLALGWAAGYVVEILAFDLTAALSARGAFYAYPLLIAAATLPAIRRGRSREPDRPPPRPLGRRDLIYLAGVCGVAIAAVGIALFAGTRLPGDGTVLYNQDAAWGISLAADLLHNFPLGDPNVAGEPLVYHYFVSAHMAAAAQVTGIELPMIFLRLYALPLVACIVLGFAAAGERIFARPAIGTTAGGLALLVGEVTFSSGQIVFLGLVFTLIVLSPSFLFGIAILIPLVALLAERLRSPRGSVPEWALVALLAIGASDAKVTILPLLGLALILYCGWSLLRSRAIPSQAVIAAAIVLGVELFIYLDQYRGHASGVAIDLTAGWHLIQNMPAILLLKDGVTDLIDPPGLGKLLSLLAIPVGLLGMLGAQLAGLWLYLRRRRTPLPTEAIWLLSALIAATIGLAFLADPDTNSQLYFVLYGTIAAGLLAAAGLVESWSEAEPRSRQRMAALVAAFAALIAIAAIVFADRGLTTGAVWAWYAGLVALLALAWLVARARLRPVALAATVVCTCLVVSGALAVAIDHVIPALKDQRPSSDRRFLLTPGLNEALVWIRDHSDSGAVLATSNPAPLSFDYAAFGERRVFLGGWAYSERSRAAGFAAVASGAVNPYGDRLAVNEAAFAGDPAAIAALRAAGVDYLLIDRVNGATVDPADLAGAGRVVFAGADATIIEL